MNCQTQSPWGCLAACIASLLEIPLAELPPYDFETVEASETFFRYLAARNVVMREAPIDGFVPFGYNIIVTRTTDGFTHAMVCLNGKPVWCPNGHKLPENWNGLIEGRRWQPCDPQYWITFCALDPAHPLGQMLDLSVPSLDEVLANAQRLHDSVKPAKRFSRPGAVEFEKFMHYALVLADCYGNAPTEDEGRAALLSALDDIQTGKIENLQDERINLPANGHRRRHHSYCVTL
jgi:hypothetical protein